MIGKSKFSLGLAAAALTFLSLTALFGSGNDEGRSRWGGEFCHESRWHAGDQQSPQ